MAGRDLEGTRLEEQTAGCVLSPGADADGRRDMQAGVNLLLGDAAHHIVEEAAHLSGIARHFRQAFLVGVEFLDHHHGQKDVVLFEAENRRRIVHQHVGVQDKQTTAHFPHADGSPA